MVTTASTRSQCPAAPRLLLRYLSLEQHLRTHCPPSALKAQLPPGRPTVPTVGVLLQGRAGPGGDGFEHLWRAHAYPVGTLLSFTPAANLTSCLSLVLLRLRPDCSVCLHSCCCLGLSSNRRPSAQLLALPPEPSPASLPPPWAAPSGLPFWLLP